MKIKYLGTAAAEGIPSIFCNCEVCKTALKRGGRNIRTRSQAVVDDGKLLLDFPPDTLMHGLIHSVNISEIKHILITHTHSDHCYLSDFYMRIPGFSHIEKTPENRLCIYGAKGTIDEFRKYFEGYNIKTDEFLCLVELEPYCENKVGDYTVIPLKATHDESSYPLIYIIKDSAGKTLFYAHDTNFFSDEVWEYIKAHPMHYDFVSMDCTNAAVPKNSYIGHMNLADNIEIKRRLTELGYADEKTIFCSNHFSHNGMNVLYEEFSEQAQRDGIKTSYDGMVEEF